KSDRRATQPRRLDSRTSWTTLRTRSSLRDPSTRHNRYRCFASLSICLIVFILEFRPWSCGQLSFGFLGQSPLILRRQNLSGDCAGRLYNQAADLLFEFGKHTSVVLRRGLPSLSDDLFSGSSGLVSFLLQQAFSRGAGFVDELRGSSIRLHHC